MTIRSEQIFGAIRAFTAATIAEAEAATVAIERIIENTKVQSDHDSTNQFVTSRERSKSSIRLMTHSERLANGLDVNGGFDGPTGAD